MIIEFSQSFFSLEPKYQNNNVRKASVHSLMSEKRVYKTKQLFHNTKDSSLFFNHNISHIQYIVFLLLSELPWDTSCKLLYGHIIFILNIIARNTGWVAYVALSGDDKSHEAVLEPGVPMEANILNLRRFWTLPA